MESYCFRRDQFWILRSCIQGKSNQNVKLWYFLKCVSCSLTISRSLWHVRHFVSKHMIKICVSVLGPMNPSVFVFFVFFCSLCFSNLCFQCEWYFNLMLYTALCLFVKCDSSNSYRNEIDLIWLLAISKVLGKVVFKQLYAYFTSNNLFCKGQYGFREDHSTKMANIRQNDHGSRWQKAANIYLYGSIESVQHSKLWNPLVQIIILWNTCCCPWLVQ